MNVCCFHHNNNVISSPSSLIYSGPTNSSHSSQHRYTADGHVEYVICMLYNEHYISHGLMNTF